MFQAARDGPQILIGTPDHLNIAKFTSAHSEGEMVDLLSMIIAKMGQCFVVIESEEQGRRFFSLFHRLVERVNGFGASQSIDRQLWAGFWI